MTKNLETAMYQAAAATFEELLFMFPTLELEDEQRAAATQATASITFHGEFDGMLTVVACGALLPAIAANMLGDDEAHSEQIQRDALGEVANIICGNVLPLITNHKAIFHLDAPKITTAPELFTDGAQSHAAKVQIGLEDGRADLLLFIKQ